jgi:starch-binding outer membrane protein, SusD/RagB family
MKSINIFSLLVLALLAGCGKSFLDQKPYASVPIDEAIKTEAEMGAAMNGVYASMRTAASWGRNLPVLGDLMADNVYVSQLNSGRYLIHNAYSQTQASGEPADMWTNIYSTIKNANVVINADILSSPVSDQLRGEALTVRALSYFDLVRWFAKPFTADANAEGVPVILEFDQNAKLARSTVSEVYTQILADLTQAFSLMSGNKNSAVVTKYVARALQAKVYLYKGDWANARDAALDVVNNSGYSIVSAANFAGYWKNATPVTTKGETLFEISLDAANNNQTTSLAYMYEQIGYGDLLVSDSLYQLYTATDVRRGLILAGTRSSLPVWILNKYSNTNSTDKDEVKILRISEVVLILAEAYYRLNDEPNALTYLNLLAQSRDPSLPAYTSTGADLLEDIITERRKELLGEGDRFQDLQRLNRIIERGEEYPAAARTIATDNPKRIQPIPQVERDANPNISQNGGY